MVNVVVFNVVMTVNLSIILGIGGGKDKKTFSNKGKMVGVWEFSTVVLL